MELAQSVNIDPILYSKYQNPSKWGSQDIALTRFFYCDNGRVEKGTYHTQYFMEFAQKFIRSYKR